MRVPNDPTKSKWQRTELRVLSLYIVFWRMYSLLRIFYLMKLKTNHSHFRRCITGIRQNTLPEAILSNSFTIITITLPNTKPSKTYQIYQFCIVMDP